MSLPRTAKVAFGGDYNPEQWPEQVWEQDYRLFDAARIDTRHPRRLRPGR